MQYNKIILYITTFNNKDKLEQLLSDLSLQTCQAFQVVVVDAASTDDTTDSLKAYQSRLNIKFISRQDTGIYYGLNTAIELMDGGHCLCLGSDDRIYNKEFISQLHRYDMCETKIYYTNITIDSHNQKRTKNFPDPVRFQQLYGGLAHLHHQSILIPFWLLKQLKYNVIFETYADLDLILRSQKHADLEKININGVCFNASGVSSSIRTALSRFKEILTIRRMNGLRPFNLRVLYSLMRQIF